MPIPTPIPTDPIPTLRSTRPRPGALHGLVALGLTLLLAACGPLSGGGGGGSDSTADVATRSAGASGADGGGTVLVLDGRSISLDELHEHMKDQFLEELLSRPEDELYEMRENAVRDLVQRHVIDSAAEERGVSPEALFEQVTGGIPGPTDEEVAAWYARNQSRLRGAQLEDVAPQIRQLLANEARGEAWRGFLEPRLAELDWEMKIEPPRKDLEATRLVRGDAGAPVTIMAFSDYQCPYCIRSEPVLAEVLDRYPDAVRLVHRHFPLDGIHPFARPASEAAMCADEQGRFWDFHDAIFARRGRLEEGSFSEIGEELGLDVAALDACIEERRYRDFVEADFVAGQAAGVTGTPAFFVNGIPLKGARDADALSRVVDAELERLGVN